MEKWEGKVAVVTGASAGIGEAIVKDFARNGINVVGLARRSEKIEEYASKLSNLKGKIYAKKCDISDLDSVKSTFKWIEEKFGVINILVNNAAVLFYGDLTDESDEAEQGIENVINTNFKGSVSCTRAGIKLIKKSDEQGIIININSIAGHSVPNYPGLNIYSPTKFALRAFTEALRLELVQKDNTKIRVSNVSPGAVKTEMAFSSMKDQSPEIIEKIYESISFLLPEEVAQTVSFLLEVPYSVNITELTVKPTGEKT
jgi:NADP+-dependent farnesol dehydrogenase